MKALTSTICILLLLNSLNFAQDSIGFSFNSDRDDTPMDENNFRSAANLLCFELKLFSLDWSLFVFDCSLLVFDCSLLDFIVLFTLFPWDV